MTQSSSLLLVDADLHGLETLTYGFEREGRKVTRTSDLTRAVQLSRTSAAKLAVVMLREPAQPALDVIASLRGVHRNLPILALGPPALQAAARDAGANDFLSTPTFIRDVVTVAKLVALAAESDASPDQTDSEAALTEFHGLFYLVRALAVTTRSCVLRLARGTHRAEIRFAEGKVVSASVQGLQKLPALHHVLLWEEAGVSIKMGAITAPSQFPLSAQEILDECERFLRDFAHAAHDLGPAKTIYLPVPEPRPAVTGIQPSQMGPLLRLFDGSRWLSEVVLESPFRIFDTVRMIKRLRDAGVLVERVPARRPSQAHQTTQAAAARNGTRQTGPQSMLSQWAMVPDQRGVVGDRRRTSRPHMPFGPNVTDQPGAGVDRRQKQSRPVAPLSAHGPGGTAPAGGRRPSRPVAPVESLNTPGPTPPPTAAPAPIPLIHKKAASATGEIPVVKQQAPAASLAALELGPTVQVKLDAHGMPLTQPTAPAVAATPPPIVTSEAPIATPIADPILAPVSVLPVDDAPPPVRTHDMPSPLDVLASAPPVMALDGGAPAEVLDTPPPPRDAAETIPPPPQPFVDLPALARELAAGALPATPALVDTPPPVREIVDAPPPTRPRGGSGPRATVGSRGKTPIPHLTPSGAFDAVEADFFAREADLYKREAVETFDDLDSSGDSSRKRK
jgi:ActR/RegA family two-component response regulator